MRLRSISPVLAAIALLLGATASFSGTENSQLGANKQSSKPNSAGGITFSCDTSSSTPITIVRISREGRQEESPMLYWIRKYFPSSSRAQQLCQQVSVKLQNYYDNGELKNFFLASGWVEGQPVACIAEKEGSECTKDRVLFTLETTDKPGNALYEMIATNFQRKLPEERPPTTRGDFPTRLGFWLLF